MTDQGAYLYRENNKLCLMIFSNVPKSILQKALPFEDISNSDYFQAFFVDGLYYVWVCNKEQINRSIRDKDMISIDDSRIYSLSNQDVVISYLIIFANRNLLDINLGIIKYQNSYKIFGYPISKKKISIYLPISLLVIGVFYLKKK